MARRPLPRDLRAKARISVYPGVYASEDGQSIQKFLEPSDETSDVYLERVKTLLDPQGRNRFSRVESELSDEFYRFIRQPILTIGEMEYRADQIKAYVQKQLDSLAD